MPTATESPTRAERIRVKLLHRITNRTWLHQLPGAMPVWGRCEFVLDPDSREYDWLVVYDELPSRRGEHRARRQEVLACPRRHTLLVTTEPSSIKAYGNAYTAQFGCVLTSQEAWALPHPDRIHSQPALHWFYGMGEGHEIPYDRMAAAAPPAKTKTISMVYSGKRQRHTLHSQRLRFMEGLMEALPELEVFGRGVRPLDDKAEALDEYRYHIALENHIGAHHWTEKLADAFLGFTLPFYAGCPNAADYFPPESFIPIDMEDLGGSVETIRRAIRDNEYERRLPHIVEARRRMLQDHNLFAVLAREIEKRHEPLVPPAEPFVLLSRHAIRRKYPLLGLRYIYEKGRARVVHAWMRKGRG
ncbi:MAG: hypothetical protein GWO16_04300 [Gammaproteobacteria bacterium]|nr:hypothetical protein [Gammaproteobacteria bacterium]NIR28889.1 hypothetical protein [Gammaproteobacteria bacterium]NIR97284.1 hypothetical protein [Gammaproteobacteria bacterium]NIT62985.1 hypothetical protein [Gammaproteobacteria bacterium]NIV19943.1 hypothetical protein [Gammaproteobacteria bacterium]